MLFVDSDDLILQCHELILYVQLRVYHNVMISKTSFGILTIVL